jgi:glycogen debranching enzyme
MLAVAELDLARLTGDVDRLRRVYPALADHQRWLQANRRLPDGTYWTTGLANGLDNSPSLGDGYPDLTAQMAHAADCLSVIAAAIGKPDEAARWRADAAATAQACNAVLWSDTLRFYATSLAGGGHNPNKVVTGFWPLWAGIVPPERVQALVQQVQDPATFGRLHPVPSLAADSPAYKTAGNYWLGSTWAPTNTAVIKGFQRAGRMDVARALTIRHLQAMLTVFDATGRLWENYCPDQEVRGNQSTQDYSWTISGPTRLLIETLIGIETDALAHRIRWTPIPRETCGIRRLAFADATVTLLQTIDAAGTGTITVTTDQPFTLELVDGAGRSEDHAIATGSVTFSR